MNYHCVAIPQEYPALVSSGVFKPEVMWPLLDEGRRLIGTSNAWRTTPPGVDKSQGETIQERWGRDLTFQQRGPQLPIPRAKGSPIPPRYPSPAPLSIPAEAYER